MEPTISHLPLFHDEASGVANADRLSRINQAQRRDVFLDRLIWFLLGAIAFLVLSLIVDSLMSPSF